MPFKRDRVKPSHYPKLPFHLIRSAQLVSSGVVACIMFYFLSELSRDHYSLPWTFILVCLQIPSQLLATDQTLQLMTVSLLTIASLTTTIILHFFYGLNPTLNTVLNSTLALLWAVSFSLLTWWSSGTLAHICNKDSWDSDLGLSVCRLYKALFSFSLFGLVATMLALVLDVHVQRQATVRGRFQQLNVLGNGGKNAQGRERGMGADGFEEQDVNPNPVAQGKKQTRGGEGYALPDEQYAYDADTTYHGAAGQVGRRSMEGRI